MAKKNWHHFRYTRLLRPEVLEILKTCDCILHAGDVDRPEILDQLRHLGNLYAVRGNNDGDWARERAPRCGLR